MIDGDLLVSFWWNRLPGSDAQGRPLRKPSFSILHFAGGGLFNYELDLMNIADVGELTAGSGWLPGPGTNFPTGAPDRNHNHRGWRCPRS